MTRPTSTTGGCSSGPSSPSCGCTPTTSDRLPWQYPQPVQGITEDFLRLREALIPYTYTLAAQAHDTACPSPSRSTSTTPTRPAAYTHPDEYLYGSDMLVAPVTSPGSVADTTVWIPPGRWVDYFTGATFTGPLTTTVAVPLTACRSSSGPVGSSPSSRLGQVDRRGRRPPDRSRCSRDRAGPSPSTRDSGSGLGYTKGQYTETPITDSVASAGHGRHGVGTSTGDHRRRCTGTTPVQPTSVGYRVELVDLTRPVAVTVGRQARSDQRSGGLRRRPAGPTSPVRPPWSSTSRSLPTTGTVVVAAGSEAGGPGRRPRPAPS